MVWASIAPLSNRRSKGEQPAGRGSGEEMKTSEAEVTAQRGTLLRATALKSSPTPTPALLQGVGFIRQFSSLYSEHRGFVEIHIWETLPTCTHTLRKGQWNLSGFDSITPTC